jgi:hypothetical protein
LENAGRSVGHGGAPLAGTGLAGVGDMDRIEAIALFVLDRVRTVLFALSLIMLLKTAWLVLV